MEEFDLKLHYLKLANLFASEGKVDIAMRFFDWFIILDKGDKLANETTKDSI